MRADWYKMFFHGVALDLWRSAVSDEQTRASLEIEWRLLLVAEKV